MKGLRWRTIVVVVSTVLGVYFAIPSLVENLPPELNNLFPDRKLRLGLDLKGGMHLVLEVDTDATVKEVLQRFGREIKEKLAENNIDVKRVAVENQELVFTLPPDTEVEIVKDSANYVYPLLMLTSTKESENEFEVRFTLPVKEIRDIKEKAVEQALETIRNRIDQFGVVEPVVVRYGADMIVVQLPGIKDVERAKSLIKRAGVLEFKLVDDENTFLEAYADRLPAGIVMEYETVRNKSVPYLRSRSITALRNFIESIKTDIPEGREILIEEIYNRDIGVRSYRTYLLFSDVLLKGDVIDDARVRFEVQFGQPYIAFSLNSRGAKIFEELTGKNVGKRLAIILDRKVKSAPVIKTKIPGGKGIIEGNFTPDEAHDLAITLRSGSLPAPVEIAEERTVGPSLGSDSIRKGMTSMIVGGLFVLLFIAFYYKLSGLIADLALVLNLIFIVAVMSLFEATLTLPGIAGIILTLGMAVDANVLIFERIREELRVGRTPRAAVDAGYRRAVITILDANLTTIMAAAILFQFGTGPIKGFAVTLTVGIAASFYTAVFVSRVIFERYLTTMKVEELSI